MTLLKRKQNAYRSALYGELKIYPVYFVHSPMLLSPFPHPFSERIKPPAKDILFSIVHLENKTLVHSVTRS